eukprot:1521130-Pleurochrysis_carterae.AAC.1
MRKRTPDALLLFPPLRLHSARASAARRTLGLPGLQILIHPQPSIHLLSSRARLPFELLFKSARAMAREQAPASYARTSSRLHVLYACTF